MQTSTNGTFLDDIFGRTPIVPHAPPVGEDPRSLSLITVERVFCSLLFFFFQISAEFSDMNGNGNENSATYLEMNERYL